jgi:hypothetical protein
MVVSPGGSVLTAFATEDRTTSPLGSVSGYQAGAQVYRAAIADLTRPPSMPAATASEIAQLLAIADRAVRGLDQRQSWMVMHFLPDPGVVAGVKGRVRDKASFDTPMQGLIKDLQVVMAIPGTVEARAVELESAWKDLQGSALLDCLGAANLRYQSCLRAIPATATAVDRNRARLRCQALWLAGKSSCNAA